MTHLRTVLLLFAFTLAASARAQISQEADYFGKIGNTDIHVTVNDGGTTAQFEYYSNGREEGSGPISNGTATFSTNRNRQVTVRVQGNTVTGTFLSQAFSATKESDIGPLSGVSGVYSGSLIEQGSNSSLAATYLLFLRLFPSGKTTLAIANVQSGGFNVHYGLGTMAASGAITFSVSSATPANNGDSLRMTFSPENDLANALLTSSFFPQRIYTYVLVRAKAATVINVATRGAVTPTQAMTAGFVVTGGAKTLLIRAVGPTLGAFGVTGANTDTKLTLFAGQAIIGTNDNWSDNANAADITAAALQVGAFALGAGSKDAVLLVHLQPGAYTAQAASVGAASGDALIEVYEVTK